LSKKVTARYIISQAAKTVTPSINIVTDIIIGVHSGGEEGCGHLEVMVSGVGILGFSHKNYVLLIKISPYQAWRKCPKHYQWSKFIFPTIW
jgi:hypothetical protein